MILSKIVAKRSALKNQSSTADIYSEIPVNFSKGSVNVKTFLSLLLSQ